MKSPRKPEVNTRRWNRAAAVLLALYVLNVIIFAASMLAPDLIDRLGLGEYRDSRSWWPILLQVLLGLGAFGCYYWPRARTSRNFSVLVTGVLAATTIFLGLVSYSTCESTDDQSPLWTPLTFALNLIGGNVADCEPGATTFPPALQLTRLLGPLLLVIAALGIVTSLFRNQYDRIRVRYSTALVLLVGLTDEAMPLLRRLSVDRESGTTLAVLVEDSGNPLIKTARDQGARVVLVDLDQTEILRGLLTSRGTFKIRSFYAVSPDVAENLRWAAQLRAVADSSKPTRGDMAPRMVVRIDDPWQAEYWRRTNAYRTGKGRSVRWMSDALSVYEVTASVLLDRILDPKWEHAFDRLVIVGNSALALAVCAELAQREREGATLSQPPQPSFADLILFGPEAETLREQHRLRQERFGNATEISLITVVTSEPNTENLRASLDHDRHPVLVLADDPAVRAPQLATYLAALNPTWTIFDWSPATRGVADEPIMERLYPFGLTTEAPSSLPVDSWERAARVVHEQYRLDMQRNGTLNPNEPAHRPWEELDPFRKETNIRQVTTALAAAENLGRSWGPVLEGVSSDGLVTTSQLSEVELDQMTRMEHESWMKHLTDNGWRFGEKRDNARRLHPSLRAFDTLSADDVEKTRQGVTNALGILESLGYRSTVLRQQPVTNVIDHDQQSRDQQSHDQLGDDQRAHDQNGWIGVVRRGEVTAVRQRAAWTWTNESGGTMEGRAGDWQVTDDHGKSWSVEPEIFTRTYAHLGGNRWRRTGSVMARPAVEGELVDSLEGRQTAHGGDWVIRGAKGEQWVTSGDHFAANYERAGGSGS